MWTDSPIGRVFAIHRSTADDEVASPLVTAYGHEASYLDRLARESGGRFVVAEIERMRPAARGTLRVVAQPSWALDPYAAGARGMEGAMESGERAALEVALALA